MLKKWSVAVLVLSLLVGTLAANFASAQTVESITIQADGSINPSTAPISKNGNVYTLTANVSASISIGISNIIFDGAGYTIQSPGWSWALELSPPTPIEPPLTNITVVNVKVMEDPAAPYWAWGILMESTTNSTIANCTVFDIRDSLGVWMSGAGNLIVGNNFTNVFHTAIYVEGKNNTITGNRITSCGNAVDFFSTSDNIIIGNHIENNSVGIHCFSQNPLPPGLRNLIYLNNFVNNTKGFLNEAVFIGETGVLMVPAIVNIWDNGTVGNYWNDYNGTDANGDGIGDTPYFVDDHYPLEGANDTDHYPLVNPFDISTATSLLTLPTITPSPTPSPSASQNPAASPSPSQVSTVPETTLPAAIIALTTAACIGLFAKKRFGKKSKESLMFEQKN